MGTLTRTVVSIVSLILALPIPGLGQNLNRTVVIVGRLQVYDRTKMVCNDQVRNETILSFTPSSQALSFDGQATAFDIECKWMGTGTLYQDTAGLTINAMFGDFVQDRPTEPIKIRGNNQNNSDIRLQGIRVILYERERFSLETRALANRALAAKDITRAIELYDVAFDNFADPETLFLKADALDQGGRYADAASTWNEALEIVSNNAAVAAGWRRAKDVPWRLTTSLYKAAKDGTEPEIWLNVAEVSRKALDLQSLEPTNRSRIMATWLDSLFNAVGGRGDYSRLSKEILSDQNMQNSWHALFYEEFRDESRPDSPSGEEIVQGIGKLESALGRKGRQR